MLFFDSDAVAVIRYVLLMMLVRNEQKRAVMKMEDGYMCVEPVPEDIASDQVLVTVTKEINESNEPVFPVEAFAFVGSEILF